MTKNSYSISFPFHFSPVIHKGAPYSLNGDNWMNKGEFLESADKIVRGLDGKKDANTAFDAGSDIPDTLTSVKSGKATLTSVKLGLDFASVKKAYFGRVHSTNWDYVVMIDDTLIIYNMNRKEFAEFMDKWATYYPDRQVIRFKDTSAKMLAWLDARVE